ncbi:MAG: ISNCY family transposase [Acidobacteria bacterium]|nr:ISNCY family transposase [Acidobacteriota bacterium]
MSEQEIRRAGVLGRVTAGELTQQEAAEVLHLSTRQVRRLCRRYEAAGAAGLVHGNAGRRSNHARSEEFRRQVLRIVRERYGGEPGERLGPTLAAEHLQADHGLGVDAETLRRWMLEAGLWSRERKRKAYRQRRARRRHFGELVQMDGSFEAWLEGRAERGCLINLVDDATSRGLGHFDEEETTWALADGYRAWVEKYGIARALYVDGKLVYGAWSRPEQQERGEAAFSQFRRMCERLGTELILAGSPQAKGRVERAHGTHQDRLIKKLRLASITDYAAANRYLRRRYWPEHNRRFAVAPAEAVDFHEPVPAGMDLDDVFSLEYERTVANDWVVRHANRFLQITTAEVRPGAKVTVRIRRDGRIELLHAGKKLKWHECAARPEKAAVAPRKRRKPVVMPAADHPWRSRAVATASR